VDAAGQAIGGLLAFRGHDHVRSFARQAQSQRFADAAACPGDDGDAAVKIGVKHRIIGHGQIRK
jgi:hypothetical protein